jgi:hypothetical protein
MPQPDGLQFEAAEMSAPPETACARIQLADINFSTSAHAHFGHLGAGSLEDSINSSKQ